MGDEPMLDITSALTAMGGDDSIFRNTVALYVEIIPKLLGAMSDAVLQDDRSKVRNHAHTIKSSSRTIGGMRLGEIAEFLETECDTASRAEIDNILRELHQLYLKMYARLSEQGYGQHVPLTSTVPKLFSHE